ncbi:alpha/beta fold hydrolase [Ruegeria faecimaris]|uniref:alpha/beta fold hydrolase n=1 Tax=Ruegeria faecimaris TaxID=686389 RepID=UPI002490CC6D|nr:alpha/beta fold hydrolase [Ruegeria faecimaris]
MKPLVMLPGMMCDARLFAPQIAALSSSNPVLYAPIGEHDTVQALAAEVLSYAPPRFVLAGLSMGGIVAMEIIRQQPQRVVSVALMDTNHLAERDDVKARRGPQIASVSSGGLGRVMAEEMKPNYLTDGPNREAILNLCMDMALGLGPDIFINQSKALRDRPDQSDTLRVYTGQALILCGKDDALCPVSRHASMHELLTNSRFEVIEQAGHLPTLEQPELTTAALSRWLEAQ